MIKAINGRYDDTTPNFAGVQEFARSGGAEAVVIWSLRWKFYEAAKGIFDQTMWHDLDAQVFRAFTDRRKIFLAVGTETPSWAVTASGPPPRASGWRLPPDDVSVNGPWAKYLEAHLLRYPYLDGIIILNEPNAAFMDRPMPGLTVAKMIKTACLLWQRHKVKPLLLAPATLDGPGALRFSAEVLAGLGPGWKPPRGVNVGWAHHPYTDIKLGLTGPQSQSWKLMMMLKAFRWPGNGGQIWNTELGYVYDVAGGPPPFPENYRYTTDLPTQEARQLANVVAYYQWAKKTKRVRLMATYEYRASLWGGWDSGLIGHDGAVRPIHDAWRNL